MEEKEPRCIVIMPACDEEATIGDVIRRVKQYQSTGLVQQILVVDDGSTDKTPEVARRAGADVVSHVINRGTGAAQQTGYEIAIQEGYNYIIQMDADGQHDPKYIPNLLKEAERSGCDMLISSRFLKFGSEVSFVRKMGIRFFSWFVSILGREHITDITSGYRLYKVERLKELEWLNDNHWAVEQTLDALNKGLRINEIAVNMPPRGKGKSQFDMKSLLYYPFKMADVFVRIAVKRVVRCCTVT